MRYLHLDGISDHLSAMFTHQQQMSKDDPPNWLPLKTCNYMMTVTEVCSRMLTAPCQSKIDVEDLKTIEIENILQKLKVSPREFDTDSCPSMKIYIRRIIDANTPDADDESDAEDIDTEKVYVDDDQIHVDPVENNQGDGEKNSAVKMFHLIFNSLMSTMQNIFVSNILTQVSANSTQYNKTEINQLKEIFQFLKKRKSI